jgi:hypothetical protein
MLYAFNDKRLLRTYCLLTWILNSARVWYLAKSSHERSICEARHASSKRPSARAYTSEPGNIDRGPKDFTPPFSVFGAHFWPFSSFLFPSNRNLLEKAEVWFCFSLSTNWRKSSLARELQTAYHRISPKTTPAQPSRCVKASLLLYIPKAAGLLLAAVSKIACNHVN